MKMTKHKKIFGIISALAIFLTFAGGTFCLAQSDLEVTYPVIGGVPVPVTTKTLLPDYITYIFNLSLLIAGLVAFVAMIAGGYKHLTSGGNPSKIADARDQMTSAIIGLAILLASVLILNTINPQLSTIAVNEIKPTGAVIELYEEIGLTGDVHYYSYSESMANFNFDTKSIKIANSVSLDDVDVYVYPLPNFKPDGGGVKIDTRTVTNVMTHPDLGWIPGSIDIAQKLPGVYLCRELDCKDCLPPKTDDVADFSTEGVDKKIKSICFRNQVENGKTYPVRAILHNDKNGRGSADVILGGGINNLDDPSLFVGLDGSSLTVMTLNPDPVPDGDGEVALCVNYGCAKENFGTATEYSGRYVYYGYNDATKGLDNFLWAEGEEIGKSDDDLQDNTPNADFPGGIHFWDGLVPAIPAPKKIEDRGDLWTAITQHGVSAVEVNGNYLVVVSTKEIPPGGSLKPLVIILRNRPGSPYDITDFFHDNYISSIRVFKLK